jgi:two-component system, cell cycle sensor histidine kinase and response regulator CckA
MAQEILGRVFEPFFTTKERGRGTGLGLSVTLGIVQGHSGHIELENRPGGGTVARIFLPAVNPLESGREKNDAVSPAAGSTGNLLIVDDDRDFLEITSELAAGEGYCVTTAASGAEALKIYREKCAEVDVVLLDVIMPVMDGMAVFKELKSINPDVKVVLCSGFSADGAAGKILAQGAAGFVQKPFETNDLFQLIGRIISN